jgi:uncharacterized membrane protein
MDLDKLEVLGCVVCGDDGDFFTLHHDPAADELICARCGQARLVPMLGAAGLAPTDRATHRVA